MSGTDEAALRTGAETPAQRAQTPLAPLGSVLLFGALAAFVLLTFQRHGISNDEEVQHIYGRLLVDFYRSGFADHAAFAYKNLYLYGGLFDVLAALLEPRVPISVWDLRHLLSAGFGVLGIAGAWRLAGLLAGERAGLVAALLLGLTGAWSGALFTHTKDVPFAACMVWALYYTVRVTARLPAPRAPDVIGLGVAIGAAFGLRVGAVFAVFYLGMAVFAAAWLLGGPGLGVRVGFVLRSLRALLPAGVVAFALTAAFWPWSVMAPGNLLAAMTTFSRFSFPLDTVLAGEVMRNGAVPGTYLSLYLLVRLPELFLLGLSFAATFGVAAARQALGREAARRQALYWFPVVLAACFPLGYTLLASPALYNGLRHFLFLLPPLAVLAAAGWVLAWQRGSATNVVRRGLALVFCALTLFHLAELTRLHPYGYVQYNRLTGGTAGAVGRWELDYWSSSLREAAALLNAHVAGEAHPRQARYRVAVCAESVQAEAHLDPRFTVTQDWRAADFFLAATHMDCHAALRGAIVGEVVRAGVVLAVVRDRRALRAEERAPR